MSTHFKIDYSRWSTDDTSPINSDIKIKTSHSKLVSQTNNSNAAKEWRKKNPNKASEIGKIGGELVGGSKKGKTHMSKIGKQYGKENAVKYIPIETKKKNGKNFGKKNLCDEIVCEKCGRKTNKGNYSQFHGSKCREENIIKFIELLPNKFTKSIAKKIANENKIKGWEKWNIFHDVCIYTKCIIKVDKPNQYNPCWYSRNIKEINKVKKYITARF